MGVNRVLRKLILKAKMRTEDYMGARLAGSYLIPSLARDRGLVLLRSREKSAPSPTTQLFDLG
jgi:hypothetical protein